VAGQSFAQLIHDSGREFVRPIPGAPAGVRIKRNPLHDGFLVATSESPVTGRLETQQFSVQGLDSLLALLCDVQRELVPPPPRRVFLLSALWEWLCT
jgi:hypothetical protein